MLCFSSDTLCLGSLPRRGESLPSLERATKYNPMYESEATTGYSHYYRRYPEPPVYSSASAEASTDFSSEEIRHIYENSELTKEVRGALNRVVFFISKTYFSTKTQIPLSKFSPLVYGILPSEGFEIESGNF